MTHCYANGRTFCSLLLLLFFLKSFSSLAQPVIGLRSVVNAATPGGLLSKPVDIVNAGDNSQRLFVVQQDGTIRVYDQNFNNLGNFLTVTGLSTGGERGLLSMAFHPNYASNGFFFVYYTNTNGDIEVARYQTPAATPNLADPSTKTVVITIPHPGQTNHNGGKLLFGADGYLYFATGDGGGGGDVPNNAQTGSNLLGKMIRINVSTGTTPPFYSIPADNPFLAAGDNIRDEIWAFGLRNPFRWSFDRLTQDMWIADVGQGAWEEVNHLPANANAGVNYGWHCFEGTHPYPGGTGCPIAGATISPVLDYPHDNATGGVAVIGGFVYRGTTYPAMYGYYLFADESSGNIWLLPPGGTATDTVQFKNALTLISSFGESETGEIYLTNLNGQVYAVSATAGAALPVKINSFTGTTVNGGNQLTWLSGVEQQVQQYEVEYSTDGIHFLQAGIVPATGAASYHFTHKPGNGNKWYYRLKMVDLDGRSAYSSTIIIRQDNNSRSGNFVSPSVINNAVLQVRLDEAFTGLQLVNMEGRVVYHQTLSSSSGHIAVYLPGLPHGQYLVRLYNNEKQLTQKIILQ
ncbi:MAG TPA: PQQ-dependent sugar dehydrogenase [Chitinophagaceae bacterium]|nr:PQQ-dependent sugar dehydrogenase [Chitinophagaceae bacterium]